jgi:fatty acid desaturase
MKPIAPMVWFYQGFQPVSAAIALVNFAVIINLWMTAKGIAISSLMIPILATAVLVVCIVAGWFQHHFRIQALMLSYVNNEQNSELTSIQKKVDAIAKKMGVD